MIAHITSSILSEHFIVQPAWGGWAAFGIFLLVAAYLVAALPRLSAGKAAVITLGLFVVLMVAAASLSVLWFGTLHQRKLINPDEGRYAEIPREMVASGDWLTPRLNDIKYFEKPALQYWATAAAYTVFGQHAWISPAPSCAFAAPVAGISLRCSTPR